MNNCIVMHRFIDPSGFVCVVVSPFERRYEVIDQYQALGFKSSTLVICTQMAYEASDWILHAPDEEITTPTVFERSKTI